MIKIDIVVAISIYLSFTLALVFIFWIFYTCNAKSVMGESNYLKQCVYCTYVFFEYKKKNVLICPRCKSYITMEKDYGSTKK